MCIDFSKILLILDKGEISLIVQTLSPFLKGELNFDNLHQRGEGIWKIKKGGWKYGSGTGLLKKGADTFPISFFQGLSFLHLEITLPFVKLLCI